MTYDDVTKALAAAGFFTYYRRESDTLICSAAEWPNVPQMANSFRLGKQLSDWSVAAWASHLYRFEDEARVPDACIACCGDTLSLHRGASTMDSRQSSLCLRLTQMIYQANNHEWPHPATFAAK